MNCHLVVVDATRWCDCERVCWWMNEKLWIVIAVVSTNTEHLHTSTYLLIKPTVHLSIYYHLPTYTGVRPCPLFSNHGILELFKSRFPCYPFRDGQPDGNVLHVRNSWTPRCVLTIGSSSRLGGSFDRLDPCSLQLNWNVQFQLRMNNSNVHWTIYQSR